METQTARQREKKQEPESMRGLSTIILIAVGCLIGYFTPQSFGKHHHSRTNMQVISETIAPGVVLTGYREPEENEQPSPQGYHYLYYLHSPGEALSDPFLITDTPVFNMRKLSPHHLSIRITGHVLHYQSLSQIEWHDHLTTIAVDLTAHSGGVPHETRSSATRSG
ncbi:hypothetical protein [Vibrio sp. MEBiC08052]|uniref:hypothetical protein n=1 Tax=Vibrio sp. MEBiC08052 TaxID=1761910 RepID=UPI0012FC8CC1|nr:hypothetical protein [Vibrio sp. MEBiC08052]